MKPSGIPDAASIYAYNVRTVAIVFVGIAILIHAGVYYDTAHKTPSSDIWIYSTREGVPARTNRQSGEIEFAGTNGWHKWGGASR